MPPVFSSTLAHQHQNLPQTPRWIKWMISTDPKTHLTSQDPKSRRQTHPRTTLASLNEDVLLEVAVYLSPLDIHALRRTCRSLRRFCSLRSVWYQASIRLISQSIYLPFDDPSITDLSLMSSETLQSIVLRAAKLDRNLIIASTRPNICLDIGTFKPPRPRFRWWPVKKHSLELAGDFKMIGTHFVVATATTGIYLWDLRKPRIWLDVIHLAPEQTVSAFDVDFAGSESATLALGIASTTGQSYLKIYMIELSTKEKHSARFIFTRMFTLPSPVKEINVSSALVVGILMSEPPYGALYVCNLSTGARGIFEPATVRLPWRVTMVDDHFALSSFDEALHSIVVQVIPQSQVMELIAVPPASYDSLEGEVRRKVIPNSECEFIYAVKGTPSAFASDWLPLSRTMPILSVSRDGGRYIVDRHQLKVTFGSSPIPTSDNPEQPSKPPLDEEEGEERKTYMEIVEHTQTCTVEGSSQGCLLSSGTVIWTRNTIPSDPSLPSSPLAMELLLSPIRESLEKAHAEGTSGGGIRCREGAGMMKTARDMELPPKLNLKKIIGMDVDERTGRLLIGLSNGQIWILNYL